MRTVRTTVTETWECGLPTHVMCERIAQNRSYERRLSEKTEELRRRNLSIMREIQRLRAKERDDKTKFVFNAEGEAKCPKCKIQHLATPRLLGDGPYRCFGCGHLALVSIV